ncbi:hypothetical protein [Crossiella sp. CA198]|uniref:hypothetical protein n=1 Tax=Crossiella sp. CA198 TaxID=3455607 RepID=UPI003F8D1219
MKLLSRTVGGGRVLVITALSAALLAGTVQPVHAGAEPPVSLTDTQWSSVLFAAGMRIKNDGIDLDKDIIASAELLDWRAANPGADARAVRIHLGELRSAFHSKLSVEQTRRPHAEILRRLLTITYDTPGTVITGPRLTRLLAVVAGRDLTQAVKTRQQRLTGTQQGLDLDAAFAGFESEVWAAVHELAGRDAVFAAGWREQIGSAAPGQPFALDVTADVNTLKSLPVLRDLVNVDAFKASGERGKTAFVAEGARQLAPAQDKLDAATQQLTDLLKATEGGQPMPGTEVPAPDQAAVELAAREAKDRQKIIDDAKGVVEYVVGAVKFLDGGAGAKLKMWAETAYKIATQANELITALKTLGAATSIGAAFGGIGAVVGAAVGLVQIFSGLLGGGADKQAQQQIMDAINRGFQNVQRSLEIIHETMTKRFDRIDSALNTIYAEMRTGFAELGQLIQQVGANLAVVHDQLLTLQTRLQSFGKAVLDGLSDGQKVEFLNAVTQYVDYPAYNNGATLPTYDNHYVPAVSRFLNMGVDVARNSTFTAHNYSDTDALSVLGSKGPAGAVDWLANYANQNYGTTFTVSQPGVGVSNVDLWASAARAYYLTALQNPKFAGQEGPAQQRATDLINTGLEVSRQTKRFNAPDTAREDKVSALYRGLATDYKSKLENFLAATSADTLRKRSPVMHEGRQFDLFNPYQQLTTEQNAKLSPPPPTTRSCDGSHWAEIKTPPFIDELDSIHAYAYPYRIGRWIDPGWGLQVCYEGAKVTRSPTEALCTSSNCQYTFHTRLDIRFFESVTGPPGPPRRWRQLNGIKYFPTCIWNGRPGQPAPPPPHCANPDVSPNLEQALQADVRYTHRFDQNHHLPVEGDPVGDLISERQARFYDVLAYETSKDGIAAGHALNNTVLLYQAFTDLGFPRAKLNDDQLHALLYGAHGLIANRPPVPGSVGSPMLTALYQQAAKAQREGGIRGKLTLELVNDNKSGTPPVDCAGFRAVGVDPISRCLHQIGAARGDRLYQRMSTQFRAVADGAQTQTLPLVDEVLDTLKLVRQHARTAYPNGLPN